MKRSSRAYGVGVSILCRSMLLDSVTLLQILRQAVSILLGNAESEMLENESSPNFHPEFAPKNAPNFPCNS